MLIDFFLHLKSAKLPVSTREFLTLLDALKHDVVSTSIDDFYFLARTCLVKDEALYDRFNLAFGSYFKGVAGLLDVYAEIPEEWLRKIIEGTLSEEEKALVKALGGWDKLIDTLRQRLAEQRGRHQGGSKWIGTAGTSPFGAYGYNPEGIRVGQQGGRSRSAIKVWDERTFRNLDDSVEINTRNIKIALRRLRRFARQGVPDEFDLDTTIEHTARNAGWLDVQMRPERRNRIKVLLFLDVGGSMDPHVQVCEELFSAAKSEFRHLEYFYFHNCVYDHVWRDNHRRRNERVATIDLLHKYGHDWKLIFVGDAAMSPYELMQPGGSVEYANEEPGAAWLARLI
ncbi:MAG TPA: VWA domain-containing protein, partial [Casimicrobiaceae bacterium]|nr:VWA domain-containing protein [Casimicrobiaceae bacterium]